jgi:hypothetical protein
MALTAVPALGCSEKQVAPQTSSSASSPGYARRFPERINAVNQKLAKQEGDAKELMGRFGSYPDEIKEPTSWPHVVQVAKYADEEGRSEAYVDRLEEVEAIARFFEEDGDEVKRKVGGSVAHAAKTKGCEADLGGSAAYAMDKAIEEQLEDRLHEESDAHTVIEDYEEELGKPNVPTLEKQADEISMASYLANIGAMRTKLDLERMVKEQSDVKSTLENDIEDLDKRSKAEGLSAQRKKALEERLAAARAAQSELEGQSVSAEQALKEADKRLEALQKEYKQAFDKLIEELEKRAAAAPKPEEKKGGA